MTRSAGTIALARFTLRLSTVIIAIIIVTTIQNVEGKGGIGRGGMFRSVSSTRGSGYRGGFGGGHYSSGIGLRARWWMIGGLAVGGGHRYRNRGYNNNADASNSTETDPTVDDASRLDAVAGVSGLFYVVIFFVFAMIKSSIRTGRYDQNKYTILHFLSFLCLAAFTIIAYHIPLTKPEESEEPSDAWEHWFPPNSTIVQYGDSPLNYFDTIYCGIGMILTLLMLMKDVSDSGKARPLSLNGITKVSLVGVVVVFATGLSIGYTSSWKVPMMLFSISAVVLSFLRYVGLLYSHQCALKLGATKKRIYYWHDATEMTAGFFSLLFHVLMACTYEEGSILVVNFAAISLAALALFFDKLFLIQLYFGDCFKRKARYIPNENEEETLSEKTI